MAVQKLLIVLIAMLVFLPACSYQVGHSFEFGTQGELLSSTIEVGVGQEILDLLKEDAVTDEGTLLYGVLYQDSMSEERFQQLLLEELPLDMGGEEGLTFDVRRWTGDDGTAFLSLIMIPEDTSLFRQAENTLGVMSSAVNDDGSVRVVIEPALLVDSATAGLGIAAGGEQEAMADLSFYFEVIMPYDIVDTSGDIEVDGDNRSAYWSYHIPGDTIPDTIYAATGTPPRSGPVAVAITGGVLIVAGLIAAFRRGRAGHRQADGENLD